ncbi:hypothetical protein PGH26_02920 [Sporosarcina jeotgali]|uniref:D-alanyl-lipoteichoic acid biosynthesis protein DltD n=1 Tax=Sporosarcina jeotgali TaxID=3020056 RepID=A0ABZ0KXK1_9BACL|nr:hypothetical protein [Sporosarcina sp. B2O-1]WOV84893.1 hypothetical protein PGH26_02920 [Sporosarcina sp. B2O-1]
MTDKKFARTALFLFLALAAATAGVNYWIDPLWHYGHANAFNSIQKVTNEREQKIAMLHYGPHDYDTLLIGSSRSTYIHPTAFEGWDVFNFSVANMSVREVHSMMLYSQSQLPDLKRYLIGVDFFKSSEREAAAPRALTNYENKINQPFYRTKNLLSLDSLEISIQNFKKSVTDTIDEDRLYNRKGEAFANRLTEEEVEKSTESKIRRFENVFYGNNYTYYKDYPMILQKIKDAAGDDTLTFYTTPISTGLFVSLVETDLLDDYEQWIRDLVDVNGGIWNFMYPNTITNDQMNYIDGHHFYPEIGTMLAKRIQNNNASDIPTDFGVYVTPDNVDEHLEEVRRLAEKAVKEKN